MVDYTVVIEFARDVVDDERHNELDDVSRWWVSVQPRAYLNNHANQNESLILALGADTLPPNLHAKSPVLGTSNPLALW